MTKSITPPLAPQKPVESIHHGIKKVDNYAWLRDKNWQQVMHDPSILDREIRKYLEAENDYTDAMMSDTKDIQKTLFKEMRGRIKEDDSTVPMPDGPYAYAIKFEEGAQHPMIMRSQRDGTNEEILLDADKLAKGKPYFDLGDTTHSPAHNLFTWSYDDLGSEYYTLRIRDLNSGQDLAEVIPETAGNAVFSKDEKYLFYTWMDENHRPCKIKRHKIGESIEKDVTVYEEPDAGFFVAVGETQSGEYIIIDSHDHQTSEIRLINADQPLEQPILIAERIEGQEYSIEHQDDRFLILTNADEAEDFKIVSVPTNSPERKNWTDIIPHKLGRLILGLTAYQDYFVRLEREDGLPRIVIHRIHDGYEHQISFEEEAYSLGLEDGYEYNTQTLRFHYSSMTTPNQVIDYEMETQTRTLRKEQVIPSGHKSKDYITKRIYAPAADDEQIPITLLYHKDTKLDGTAPCLQYGYGSYGISMPASFMTNCLSLVDRGFVYAIAHIRGGKEKGFHWYKTGRREFKTNSFEDFVSVTCYLAEEGILNKAKIVAHGGSAGGLLVGAVANMAPELYQGIIAEVPFVDVLNTMLDDTLPLTPPEWPEWGNPIVDKKAYEYISSYSPYDNIAKFNYPAILANAGLTDPRVTYWEPAKWVAKLRTVNQSKNPILLNTKMESGHGGASGRFDRLEEVAFNYAFALKICGKL